jgi:DNA-binding SARP family transcriptional activator
MHLISAERLPRRWISTTEEVVKDAGPGQATIDHGYIPRKALLNRLAKRGEVRLSVIQGGPGFGKSVLIDQYTDDLGENVFDHVVVCTPAHRHLSRIAESIHRRLDLDLTPSDDIEVEASVIANAIALHAPNHVVFTFDDVQFIAGSSSEEFLRSLLAALPNNGHLVLAGHNIPEFPVASLIAKGQAIIVTEEDLAYSDAEWELFALERNVDISSDIRWPALAELSAATGGNRLVRSYLLEEIVRGLNAEQRWLLGAVIAVGGADDELASVMVGRPVSVDGELRLVSLVRIDRAGWARPHQLWREALTDLVTAIQRRDAVVQAASFHADRHREAEAARLLVGAGMWNEAGMSVLSALSAQPPSVPMDELSGWLENLPSSALTEPGWRLATALRTYERSLDGARTQLEELVNDLAATQQPVATITALFHLGTIARRTGDMELLDSVAQRLEPLAAEGHARAAAVRATVRSFQFQVEGRALEGLSVFNDVPFHRVLPEQQAHLRMMEGNLHLLAANPTRAIECYESAGKRGSSAVRLLARELTASARFIAGETEIAISLERECLAQARRMGLGSRVAQFRAMLATMLALEGKTDEAADLIADGDATTGKKSADVETRVLSLLAEALVLHAHGQPSLANALLNEIPTPIGNLQRAMAFPAGTILGLRLPSALDWRLVPAPLVQQLCALVDQDDPGIGSFAHLVPIRNGRLPSANREPIPVVEMVEIQILGPLRLQGSVEHKTSTWRRPRVRELAAALIIHGPMHRDALADLLWPDQDPVASQRSLRVHLSLLRDALEPDRSRDGQSLSLTDSSGRIALGPQVVTDLETFRNSLRAALVAEESNDAIGALNAYRQVLAVWAGRPASDLDVAWIEPTRVELESQHTTAAIRTADLALALGRNAIAIEAAESVVTNDPYNEAGWRLLADARSRGGDRLGALRALERAFESAAELGVSVDDPTQDLADRLGLPNRHQHRRPA